MDVFFELVKLTLYMLVSSLLIAMTARAILSWFPMDSNKFTDFLYAVTEPFIYPVRMLFQKMNWFSGLPIDISFLVSYMIISVVLIILPQV